LAEKKADYLMPALIAGGAAGVLSAIPVVNLFNCICCLWIIGAGAAAVLILKRNTPRRLTTGDGALTGAATGIIAAVVQALVGIPFRGPNAAVSRRFLEVMSEFTRDMPSDWQAFAENQTGPLSPAFFLLGLLVSAAAFAVFGALGGVLGTALFQRSQPKTTFQSSGPGDAS